jgi:hypothetical protein
MIKIRITVRIMVRVSVRVVRLCDEYHHTNEDDEYHHTTTHARMMYIIIEKERMYCVARTDFCTSTKLRMRSMSLN